MFSAMRRLACALVVLACLVGGCRSPMAKIEGLRDAISADDDQGIRSVAEGVPTCSDTTPVALRPEQPSPRDKGCLSDIANALGSKRGFSPSPPDQAAAATAALLVARDGRGDLVAHADPWLDLMKSGTGPGVDALRAAVARAMDKAAPIVGKDIQTDPDALAALKEIGSAIPGACPTYRMLGTGTDPKTIPAELSAEHSACVQKDLGRREGPGGRYGAGIFRALEGSLALWRETERALRLGAPKMSPKAKVVLEKHLAVIEPATLKIKTKQVEADTSRATMDFLGDIHAEAGVRLFKDAGADAASEAGAPKK